MRISKESLQGYLLEEVLAYLVKNAGYVLLTDPSQDPYELEIRGNGLVVKGRGSVHQADVLGQLNWIPTFIFPIRLFIEAKFRKRKTGINTVRNAIGVLTDINQNYIKVKDHNFFRQRYQYNYAIFSTSGFSKQATELALAHNISLIDLNPYEYKDLLDSIRSAVDKLLENHHINERTEDNDQNEISEGRSEFVKSIRNSIRSKLETSLNISPQGNYDSQLRELLIKVQNYSELFMAMANGPFMLLLKADNVDDFRNYANNNPHHKVRITWSENIERGTRWVIEPISMAYRLTFKLPKELSDWIFNSEGKPKIRAINIKESLLSNITIYRVEEGKDIIYRLEYDAEETSMYVNSKNNIKH